MGLLDLAVDAVTPWYIKWPIRALGGIKAGIAWVFSKPIHIALTVAALALAWGFYERHEAAKYEQQADHCAAATIARAKAAKAAEAQVKATSHTIAETNIAHHTSTVAAIDAGANRYAATHRVRLPTPSAAPSSPAGPALPADPAPPPLMGVAVPDADFKACNSDAAYRDGAFDLIQSWIAQGLAVPEPATTTTPAPEPKG